MLLICEKQKLDILSQFQHPDGSFSPNGYLIPWHLIQNWESFTLVIFAGV
jgi:hypothetical protein